MQHCEKLPRLLTLSSLQQSSDRIGFFIVG